MACSGVPWCATVDDDGQPSEGSACRRRGRADRCWDHRDLEHPRLHGSSGWHHRHDPRLFLCELLTVRPDELMAALEIQATGYRRRSLSVVGLVEQLAGVAPDFAARASILL